MDLAIDLRGLNYRLLTGVNTYTLHILFALKQMKLQNPKLKITAIGIHPKRWNELTLSFPFLKEVVDSHQTTTEYLGWPRFLNHPKFLNLIFFIALFFEFGLIRKKVLRFDLLFLPQPRLLPINPQTRLITVYHDLFGVLQPHTQPLAQKILNHPKLYHYLSRHSWYNVVVSTSTGQDLLKTFSPKQESLKLVYSALPLWEKLEAKAPVKTQEKDLPITKPYILALSGVEFRKNWHNLILAHKYLIDTDPEYNLNLVLAGPVVDQAYYRFLLKLIERSDISRVYWQHSLSQSHKNTLLNQSEFIVYPSLYEGFGFPILEAFSHHKAVLTSNISSMPEIAQDGGLFVNPLNYQDIAHGIQILYKDKQFREMLESQTQKNLEKYSWDEYNRFLATILVSAIH